MQNTGEKCMRQFDRGNIVTCWIHNYCALRLLSNNRHFSHRQTLQLKGCYRLTMLWRPIIVHPPCPYIFLPSLSDISLTTNHWLLSSPSPSSHTPYWFCSFLSQTCISPCRGERRGFSSDAVGPVSCFYTTHY